MREHGGIVAELQAQLRYTGGSRNAPGRINATHAAAHLDFSGV